MVNAMRKRNFENLIKETREKEKLNSLAELGRRYDINPTYYSQLLNGTRDLGEKAARKIEKTFSLPNGWLDQNHIENNNGVAVQGDNKNSGTQTTTTYTTTNNHYYNTPTPEQNISPKLKPIDDWDSNTPLDEYETEITFYKDFRFACGHGSSSEAIANENRKLRISKATINRIGSHKDMIFATVADGDSMSPTINDGATIWVDTSKQTIKDGKIFVFEYGGLFMCKRLYRLPNDGLKIVSDNEIDYPTFEITGEQRQKNGFRLIGWVWHWSVMERW